MNKESKKLQLLNSLIAGEISKLEYSRKIEELNNSWIDKLGERIHLAIEKKHHK